MDTYNKITQLISRWSEFEHKTGSSDMADFGRWLSCDDEKRITEPAGVSPEADDHMTFYKQMPPARQFLTLLSRGARFLDFYLKKAFEGLEISSRLEFQFLVSIYEMKNPRKTDVIYFNLVELSTGVETLKRMQKNGLVTDFPDPADKRTKRLVLTAKGNEVLSAALKKFQWLDLLVNSFGSDDSWQAFSPSLMWFNDFHNEVYHKHKEKSFEQLMDLILRTKSD
ncbi:MAG: MarR family transcriptional regulator [Bacteroidetes bacterium]|nr:MAG: MarR family transcriptional regulator [Bacteroidota bacterium]